MSDVSQGPGWWLASDDKWYPPEQHPDVTAAPPAPPPGFPPQQPPAYGGPGSVAVPAATGRSLIKKPVILVVAVVVILAVVGGTLVVALGGSTSSAQSVASAMATDLQSGNFTELCTLATSAQGERCRSDVSQLSTHHIAYKHVAVGTVTVNGDRALFVFTGTVCEGSGQCLSNKDAHAATDEGKTFDQVYANAAGPSSSSPFIIPLVEQDGSWHVTGF